MVRAVALLVLVLTRAISADAADATIKKSVDLGGNGTMELQVPNDFKLTTQPVGAVTVKLEPMNRKASLLITVLLSDRHDRDDTPGKLDALFTSVATAQYLGGSVEKEVKLTRFGGGQRFGTYAVFTDASLVGKTTRPGQWKQVAAGVIHDGNALLNFTLYADDVGSPDAARALAIAQSEQCTVTKVPPGGADADADADADTEGGGVTRLKVPGTDATLSFLDLGFSKLEHQAEGRNHEWSGAGKGGFIISIFVEDARKPNATAKDVYDFYWPKAAQNPLIDPGSPKMEQIAGLVKSTYTMAGMRNVNYYLAASSRWIDVHLSKPVAEKDDDERFAAFEKALSCGK